MMKIIISLILALGLTNASVCMQGSKEGPDDTHSVVVTSFLWRYAIATFCDIDERGVYYNGITAADNDTCFMLPWSRVKTVLDKAYQDLSKFDVDKPQSELKEEYRNSLKEIHRNLDPAVYENTRFQQVSESRKRYRTAWASGDVTQIKAVLKDDHELWTPHID